MDGKICQSMKFTNAHSFLGTTKHLEKVRILILTLIEDW